MSDGTHIEWADASWNPLRARSSQSHEQDFPNGWHCERVSPGCQNCYAETLNEKRFGTGLPYNRKSRDRVETFLDGSVLTKPLHWRKPRRVFVCSMTDLFGEWVKDEWIDQMFAVMAMTPQHTYIVLTKRPERMREYLAAQDREPISGAGTRRQVAMVALGMGLEALAANPSSTLGDHLVIERGIGLRDWPLPNVQLGVSAEDQETLDARVPVLLATPAAVRVVSLEPLLEAVTLCVCDHSERHYRECLLAGLDHVIVGGESGPHARPCDIGWIRSVVQQCQGAGVAVFCKQLGSNPTGAWFPDDYEARRPAAWKPVKTAGRWRLSNRHGADMDEWPEDLKLRELPHA